MMKDNDWAEYAREWTGGPVFDYGDEGFAFFSDYYGEWVRVEQASGQAYLSTDPTVVEYLSTTPTVLEVGPPEMIPEWIRGRPWDCVCGARMDEHRDDRGPDAGLKGPDGSGEYEEVVEW